MDNKELNYNIDIIKSLIEIYNFKDRNIVIFGSGNRGKTINKKLKRLGININYFCDNDETKHNKIIDGVKCISFQELNKYKESSVIIVSPLNNLDIVNQLKVNGFEMLFNIEGELYSFLQFIPDFDVKLLKKFYEFGHFYSLYPNLEEIKSREDDIFNKNKIVKNIDFNIEEQCKILKSMKTFYSAIPDWKNINSVENTKYRYRLFNPNLSFGDAVGLHCMLRILKPKNIIEVGSGYTSAVSLDTNEYYLNNSINITFIEPYADLLKSLLKPDDNVSILEKGLQYVDLSYFETLNEGDVLFIDSTHVSKINSDVNYLFFEILPRLKKGVYIHLHDIFYPFEYPKEWVYSGQIWNELYLLRAFLQNNYDYKIVFFQNMLEETHRELYQKDWNFEHSFHGGSFWMQKIR